MSVAAEHGAQAQARPGLGRVLRVLGKSPQALLGILLVAVVLIVAIGAPLFDLPSPVQQSLTRTFTPPMWADGGSPNHVLGTDHLGRDVLSRIVWGARISIFVASGAAIVSAIFGVLLGVVAGYFGGRLDTILMRIVDVQLAFPLLLLSLAVIAVLGPSITNLIIVMALTSWVIYARLVRGLSLSLRQRDYVQAAHALGASDARIIFHHMLPNLFPTVVAVFTFELARMLLIEAALSFLGLGVPPPTPTWGRMLADGRNYMTIAQWVITYPGIAIMVSVLGINMLGDAIRDMVDVKLQT
jgi:peptide/nickel transport system permease protein